MPGYVKKDFKRCIVSWMPCFSSLLCCWYFIRIVKLSRSMFQHGRTDSFNNVTKFCATNAWCFIYWSISSLHPKNLLKIFILRTPSNSSKTYKLFSRTVDDARFETGKKSVQWIGKAPTKVWLWLWSHLKTQPSCSVSGKISTAEVISVFVKQF